MNFQIWLIFVVLSLLFFFISFKYKSDNPEEAHIFMLVGAFFMLMSGLFVLALGVEFPSSLGTNISVVNSSYIVTPSSTIIRGSLESSYGLSWALILLACGMFWASIFSWMKYVDGKKNKNYSEDED